MKLVHIDSLSLPKGFPILEYETLDEIIKDGGTDARVTGVVNNYLHQKDGLVQGRDELATYIEKQFKFPMKTKTVKRTVDGKETTFTVPDETEGKFIGRFVSAIVDGSSTAVSVTGTNLEQREAQVWNALQAIVDKPQKLTIDGKEVTFFSLKNDIKVAERVGKPKTPPQYALEGAAQIIGNKSEAKWTKTFEKDGVPFEPFTVAGDNDGNITRLAWAIKAREDMRARKEYA